MSDQNNKRRREQEGTPADRLTSLHDDLLISILSFLSVKQRVALSAVCSRFRRLLPSIPRLDAFRLDVGLPFGGVDVHKELTFPRALIHQCHVIFPDYIPKSLVQLVVDNLVEVGVQNLIIKETSDNERWLDASGKYCSLFDIKSLRILSLDNIQVSEYFNRPVSPLGCAFLTSLKMESCFLSDGFLRNLFASCPFLETLQLIRCCAFELDTEKLSFHSASIKHLIVFQIDMLPSIINIDVRAPQLESLMVDVVDRLRIEAPKVRNASFLLAIEPPADPRGALMKLFGASFRRRTAWLLLNSSKIPNILAEAEGIDQFNYPKEYAMIFKLDFTLKDQSSTTILTELLKKCNDCNTKFDIHVDPTRMQMMCCTEKARDGKHLLHGSTGLELINLQMKMPTRIFERFLSNRKKMKKFKDTGLEMLRRRISKKQLVDILACEESLFQISSSIDNCIEMKI
ncbi:uncharacterized protein LOC141830459 [Curcuma longa]|uniref:uncharacterized protein LOC141830459 n=1 Tax=Curcuma longa TaxID=136217 RepID=UPI003D9E48F5